MQGRTVLWADSQAQCFSPFWCLQSLWVYLLCFIWSPDWSSAFCFPYVYWKKGSTSKDVLMFLVPGWLCFQALPCMWPTLPGHVWRSYLTSLEAVQALELTLVGLELHKSWHVCLLYWSWHSAVELATSGRWEGYIACRSLEIEVNGPVMCIWQCFIIIACQFAFDLFPFNFSQI